MTGKSAFQLKNPYAGRRSLCRQYHSCQSFKSGGREDCHIAVLSRRSNNNLLINNYLYGVQSAINGDQGDAKVDWNISDKDRMFGRFSQSVIDNPTTRSFPLLYNGFANFPTHNGVLDWTRTVNPSFVNDARIGVNYVLVNNGAAANDLSNFADTVGIPGVPSTFLPSQAFTGGLASNFGNATLLSCLPTP